MSFVVKTDKGRCKFFGLLLHILFLDFSMLHICFKFVKNSYEFCCENTRDVTMFSHRLLQMYFQIKLRNIVKNRLLHYYCETFCFFVTSSEKSYEDLLNYFFSLRERVFIAKHG